MDFLGIPSCAGFGLHADSYRYDFMTFLLIFYEHVTLRFFSLPCRFLIFPDMGRSLHSVIEKENKPLSESVVLQLACRIVSVLLDVCLSGGLHDSGNRV